ncbi:MAG: phage protease [Candidatus Contendobacter sp.]
MNRSLATALCFALDGSAPDWIELIPPGPQVTGADGRAWVNDAPDAIVAAFQARQRPLVIDWEHATEHRAPQGLDAPAAGWIDRIENRGGAIWGHAEWTAKASAQIADKSYRFLSPVFLYDKQSTRIVALTSVGLTNTPNLALTALNREEPPVSLSPALLAALDLPATTTDETAVVTAIRALRTDLATAKNRAETPLLEKFVPRADYDAALARATNAEQKLAAVETAQRDGQINNLIEKALADCKISPATQDYYAAMCKTEGGFDAFKAFLDKAPPILGAKSALDSAKKPARGETLSETEQAICRALGITPEHYRTSEEST